MNPRPLPSIDQILDAFDYDAALSMFFYKDDPRYKGKRHPAGQPVDGYIRVSMAGHAWAAHRLIWKLYTGSDPTGVIDHINGIRYDNRVENLRDVTPDINRRNRHERLHVRLMLENKTIDRARRLAERENKERSLLAKLQAKYGCRTCPR